MRIQKSFSTPSLTKQSHRDECDINRIMAKYEKTGVIDHVNTYQGNYGDATGVTSYHQAMNQIRAADDAFMSLPSQIRAKFQNDPGTFLEFMDDPENNDEKILLGLLNEPTGARVPPSTAGDPDPGSTSNASPEAPEAAPAAE